jgi:cobalt-zinc-cadmium efflux system membrane fusion protein
MSPQRTRLLAAVILFAALALGVEEWIRRYGLPFRQEAPTPAGHESSAREAGEHGEENEGRREVTLSEEGFRNARIETARATRERLVRALAFSGEVTFHPDRVAAVGPQVAARVVRLAAGVGDRVERGQLLATLDSTASAQARGASTVARARRDAAMVILTRQERLRSEGINATREVDEARANLRAAEAELSSAEGALTALRLGSGASGATVVLRSPIPGVVIARDAIIGQPVEATATLFTVADPSQVWVILRAYERDLGRIAVGAPVIVTTTAFPGRTFAGRATYVGATLDERTRTVPVRVEVQNADGALRPGLFVRAELAMTGVPAPEGDAGRAEETAEREEEARDAGTGDREEEEREAREALVVPVAAVHEVGDDDVVFVQVAPRRFAVRRVELGERSGERVEVRRGLREGDEVATEGSVTLKAEFDRANLGEGEEEGE